MVTKLDVFLAVGLFKDATSKELLEKMQKKAPSYDSLYKMLTKLQNEDLVQHDSGKYSLSNNIKSRNLFWIVYYCFANNMDYNTVISEKTAEFVKIGLENEKITKLPFDPKTVQKLVWSLSKKGFLIIESRKPLSCIEVYSIFLEKLVKYFSGEVKIKNKNLVLALNENEINSKLEKEFSKYKKLEKRGLEFDEVGFIHTSLSLEGNTLTLPETEKLLQKNITPLSKPFKDAQQTIDYKKALDEFLIVEKQINLTNILDFHKTAMNSLKAGAGEIRKEPVKIKGNPNFKPIDWHLIPQALENFFVRVNDFSNLKKAKATELVEKAALLHAEFQHIHPFVDGNSRTSRAIFTKSLMDKGFPLIKIPIGFFDQYMSQTKLSEKRNDPEFKALMKIIALENLKQINEKIEHEANF